MVSIKPIHKYDCDVLIVGGGPSGSALAYHLAAQGIKVTVAEAEEFPRDKVCGDAVSAVALSELHQMGITDLEGFSRTNQVNDVALFIEEEKITVGLSRSEKHPFPGRVIPRLILDNWIHEAAAKKGASFLEGSRVVDYTAGEGGVVVQSKSGKNTFSLKCKLIVGADGSNSMVSRKLNGNKPSEAYQLLGLRAYYENVDGPSDRCDIFFTRENFPGLFWLFPTGNGQANIGSAMIASTLPQHQNHVKKILADQILTNHHFAERIGSGSLKGKIYGWPLTFQDPRSNIIGNRVLVVGDAAGLINPLSGDGIQYALLSGRWAAESISVCLRSNDFSRQALEVYRKKLDDEMAYDMALSQLLIQITRNRTFTSFWMEILKIVFERAKTDKEYAAIIGGIFDGSLPSYQALKPTFILKSILQGAIHFGTQAAGNVVEGPATWIDKSRKAGLAGRKVMETIRKDPAAQLKWLAGVAGKGLRVGGHIFRELRTSRQA